MGVTKPRRNILGQEFAGEVEAVGTDVSAFRPGNELYGTTGFGFGAYAEYLCLTVSSPGHAVAVKPIRMSFEEAATVPTGGLEALHFLRRAGPLAGRRVLINGAGGGIGIFAVQLAKYFGAEVTAVDSGAKVEMIRSLGADRILDYAREDFAVMGETYDVVFDVIGTKSLSKCLRVVRTGGTYLSSNPRFSAMIRGPWNSRVEGKKVVLRTAGPTTQDLDFLRELIDAGKLRTVIDRQFPLGQVPDAHRYVDAGLARGRVVIAI